MAMANEWMLWLTLSTIVTARHSGVSPIHNNQVCSTWGNFHVKTFDGDVFQLHSTCSYVLTSFCKGSYKDFNIQIRRQDAGGHSSISNIVIMLEGTVVELSKGSVVIDGKTAILPFSQAGVLIEKTPTYIKIKAKLGLVAIWNEEDSFLVELDLKYKNQTCGLCGDFNGVQLYNEFYSHGTLGLILIGMKISPTDFANFWKMDGPTESCSDYTPESTQSCNDNKPLCEQILTGVAFNSCLSLLDVASFTSACVADLCHCGNGVDESADALCLCNTVSEFSRHVCESGQWKCMEDNCPGTCAVEGGAHINTFDGKVYTFHGDCSYVLAKVITIKPNGKVFVNGLYAQLPFSAVSYTFLMHIDLGIKTQKILTNNIHKLNRSVRFRFPKQLPECRIFSMFCLNSCAGISAFTASSFYLLVQTSVGVLLEVQLQPVMQLYLTVTSDYQAKTCGLCGNFNSNQADDFLKLSGVPDATAAGFVNSWKTHAGCADVKSNFENPCSLSLSNERYAQHWCSMLSDPQGVFTSCHSEISPDSYKENCMYDSCNCEKSEDCMCAAVSSYVHACAAAGIQISGWRKNICGKYASSCPSSMVYSYNITSSSRTCRCISTTDLSCHFSFPPIDGCICAEGTYLDDSGNCVPSQACPCYVKDAVVPPGQVINKDGVMWYENESVYYCVIACDFYVFWLVEMSFHNTSSFFNCSANGPAAKGTECEKSCNTLDMACVSTGCISGCMCPYGMISDGKGGCIKPEACSCVHNGISYQPGETTKVDCNTCTCEDRKWQCTSNQCDGTCSVYGDGHYMTFDQKRFTFDGSCEYILTQDYCGSAESNGTFRVITENVPCGTTGTTCSKTIKVFLGSTELILTDGSYQLLSKDNEEIVPFHYSTVGIYLVVEANNGLILMWDRKTSLFIKLSPKYKGQVCGLCGNYDSNANNDFTTRCHAVVVNPLVFGNSWKDSPSCPDAQSITGPCTANPYRHSWAQKKCSIIQSDVFAGCHSIVDPAPYYEACVFDSCACDTGGDCECFCTAVAAYAESCNQAGICIRWRTPKICPLFCDYYNPPGECEWHYMPCGSPCMKTCRNPSGNCLDTSQIPPLEACTCTYNGKKYPPGNTIYNTTDGHGNCITAVCGNNGTIDKESYRCLVPTWTPTSTPTTTTANQSPTTFVFVSTTPGSIVYNKTDYDDYCYTGYCSENCSIVLIHDNCSSPLPCIDVYPPRKNGESWKEKCNIGTCDNGHVTYKQAHCPTPKPVVCANKLPAIKVQDDDECCYHYECQCICYGWGDPHYVTFDGTYYSFQGNCSYWLVKEILLKYNFSVMIDNYYCGASDGLSCPQSITVFYKNYKIFITQKDINGIFTNQISVNDKPVHLAYQNGDFRVTTTGIDTMLIIPNIHAKVSFSGLIFSIYLPYSEFGGNTQGQCGTCDNNRTDDCMLPSGKIDPSCPNMAHEWHTNDSYCERPFHPTPSPTPYPCDTTICEIIKSRYNQKFIYAVSEFSDMTNTKLEGCHCPKDTFLLSSNSNECVPTCEICRLANGKWTKANAKWIEGCEECICEEDTLQVTCRSVGCPKEPPLSCDQEGQVKVTDTDGCCQKEKCECDVKQCPGVLSCPAGYTLNTIMGVCCHKYICVPKKDICVFNNHEYQVEDLVPMKPCDKCICSHQINASSNLHTIDCQPIPCDIHCPLPGTIWAPAGNPCVRFECTKIANQFITIDTKTMCPPYNPDECILHTCSCCQELATSVRQTQLFCPDNTEISYTYMHINACGCLKTECSEFRQSEMVTTPSSVKSRQRRRVDNSQD
ncbi:hypothetical protein PAMP_001038 [Pampus punctatissimus]